MLNKTGSLDISGPDRGKFTPPLLILQVKVTINAFISLLEVFTLQAAYFSLAFFLLLLTFMPMSWKALKTYRPVQNHSSCQDTEHLCLRFWIARLQMAVKCKPCLNQFHSMIKNCYFN